MQKINLRDVPNEQWADRHEAELLRRIASDPDEGLDPVGDPARDCLRAEMMRLPREQWTDAHEAEIRRELEARAADDMPVQTQSFAEAFPEWAADTARRRGRPPIENPKLSLKLRLDADVVERFKAEGKGWQTRMNQALRKAVGL